MTRSTSPMKPCFPPVPDSKDLGVREETRKLTKGRDKVYEVSLSQKDKYCMTCLIRAT